ncbi:hypothetical protein R1sor_003413 [Riccia sorocarpa]|uniref:WDR19 WD40 repeat domain-containing protein n=1 Tax=Riccia sorocarpa TaxID=122646 RepID=A0ABD3H5M8_9MARC
MVAEAGGTRTFKKKKSEHYQVSLVEDSVELRKLSSPEYGRKKLPEKGSLADVTCVDLTTEVLIFGTVRGHLHYYYLDEADAWLSYEYCHCDGGVKRLRANPDGTRVLFEDDRHTIYLHNPFKDQACQHSGNVKLLTSLRALENLEEYLLLRGYILALSGDTDAAEASFMKSSMLEVALELRWDLEQWDRAIALARELQSPLEIKISKKYALVLEKQGDYRQALSYYEQYLKTSTLDTEQRAIAKAGIARTSVRLGDIWKGKHLVTECSDSLLNSKCAKMLEGLNLHEDAAKLYVLDGLKRTEEAKELAQQQDKMDMYTEHVADVASEEECSKLGKYYEAMGNYEKATAMFERCGNVKHALKLYLSLGTPEAMEQAINMVGRQRDEGLTNELLEFLTPDLESSNKSSRTLFRVHMVLGNYEAATRVALLIAQKEQESGNYKIAHQQLLDLCKVLKREKQHVPYELSKQLMLLHSYTLVKTLIRLGDHKSCTRLLIRMAKHISNFPAHVVLSQEILYRGGYQGPASQGVRDQPRQVVTPISPA